MTLMLSLAGLLAAVTLHHLAFHLAVHLLAAAGVLALLAGLAVLHLAVLHLAMLHLALLLLLRLAGLRVRRGSLSGNGCGNAEPGSATLTSLEV